MAEPDLLASGFDFLECPRADCAGGLYFADSDTVYYLDQKGRIHRVLDRTCGGIAIARNGGIIISGKDISFLRNEKLSVIFKLHGYEWNDIFTDQTGRLYCGSIGPTVSATSDETIPGALWRVDSSSAATQLYDDVGFSNGIGFSPDGSTLYHVDSYRREIIVHEVTSAGEVLFRTRLSTVEAPGFPDGLAVDLEGYLWVGMYEGGCVARFTPSGQLDQTVELPARHVTSLCFTGQDRRNLTVVTCDNTRRPELKGCIYRFETTVPGVPVPQADI